METWTPLITAAGIALFGWLVLLVFQLGDIGRSLFHARTAHDQRVIGRTGRRVTEYFWALPVTAVLGVALAFGVDYASRLLFDDDQLLPALIAAAIVVVVALFAGLGLVWAMTRPELPSYATIRSQIEDELAERASRARLDAFREQLIAVDRRVGYLRTYPQRTVTNLLWTKTWLRLGPVLVAAAPFVLFAIVVVGSGEAGLWWILALLLLPVGISYLLAWAGARASLRANIAWRAVFATQRGEVEGLLAGAEKSTRKGVAGLGERVTKALQILREQQD